MNTNPVITAKSFDAMVKSMSSAEIKVYRNITATSTTTLTINASSIFPDVSVFKSFDAYVIMSGQTTATHWGRIQNTYGAINDIKQPSKGVFNLSVSVKGGSGYGSVNGSITFDLMVIGRYVDGYVIPRKQYPTVGLTSSNPAKTAKEIRASGKDAISGVYWLKPDGMNTAFQCYCEFDEFGSWMLVWSNLRGKTGRPTTSMTWSTATTLASPIVHGTISANKELFEVYTPLSSWNKMMKDVKGKLKYEWRHDYNAPYRDKMLICDIDPFTSADSYKLKLSNATKDTDAGLFQYHNNRPFSTYDSDHDAYVSNCPNLYSKTPWWYGACWSGSINGGGENSGSGYVNGAYWKDSVKAWGTSNGNGGGNGWIFIHCI